MALNIAALVVVVLFYAAILIVGLVAGYVYGVKGDVTAELAAVAGRNLNVVVGVFTMAGQCFESWDPSCLHGLT